VLAIREEKRGEREKKKTEREKRSVLNKTTKKIQNFRNNGHCHSSETLDEKEVKTRRERKSTTKKNKKQKKTERKKTDKNDNKKFKQSGTGKR